MGLTDFFSSVFQSLMQIIPKPIKFIIFLFLCLTVINLVQVIGFSAFYDCSTGVPYQYNGNKFKCDVMGAQLAHCKAEWFFNYVNASGSTKMLSDSAFGSSQAIISMEGVIFNRDILGLPARIFAWIMDVGDSLTKDPCMLTLNITDVETGESTRELYNVTNFRSIDIFNYCGATISPSYTDKRRDLLSIGCSGTAPAILIGEKIDPFSYKLWLILALVGTIGYFAYNKSVD